MGGQHREREGGAPASRCAHAARAAASARRRARQLGRCERHATLCLTLCAPHMLCCAAQVYAVALYVEAEKAARELGIRDRLGSGFRVGRPRRGLGSGFRAGRPRQVRVRV